MLVMVLLVTSQNAHLENPNEIHLNEFQQVELNPFVI